MGTSFVVRPLDDASKRFLAAEGVPYPDVTSRFPTGRELKAALADLAGYSVELVDHGATGFWEFDITCDDENHQRWDAPWGAVIGLGRIAADDEEQTFSFQRGNDQVILRILRSLAAVCGPLMLVCAAGGPPEVITAD